MAVQRLYKGCASKGNHAAREASTVQHIDVTTCRNCCTSYIKPACMCCQFASCMLSLYNGTESHVARCAACLLGTSSFDPRSGSAGRHSSDATAAPHCPAKFACGILEQRYRRRQHVSRRQHAKGVRDPVCYAYPVATQTADGCRLRWRVGSIV